MKKNYYDLLEVSKNASPEVIEKVYKLLAKKYHPDLQPSDKKAECEEMFKKISIAYETLSNPKLRAEYDAQLEEAENSISSNPKNFEQNQNITKKVEPSSPKSTETNKTYSTSYKSPINSFFSNIQAKNNKSTPIFTIKLPKLKDAFIVSLFIVFIMSLLYMIPFTRNYFYTLYNRYNILRIFISLIKGIFIGIFNAIETLFN